MSSSGECSRGVLGSLQRESKTDRDRDRQTERQTDRETLYSQKSSKYARARERDSKFILHNTIEIQVNHSLVEQTPPWLLVHVLVFDTHNVLRFEGVGRIERRFACRIVARDQVRACGCLGLLAQFRHLIKGLRAAREQAHKQTAFGALGNKSIHEQAYRS
jgi:hypothetical protein